MQVNNVIGQVLGGQKRVFDGVSTVGDVRQKLGLGAQYRATVDGDAADDSAELSEGNYVSFAEAVKGA